MEMSMRWGPSTLFSRCWDQAMSGMVSMSGSAWQGGKKRRIAYWGSNKDNVVAIIVSTLADGGGVERCRDQANSGMVSIPKSAWQGKTHMSSGVGWSDAAGAWNEACNHEFDKRFALQVLGARDQRVGVDVRVCAENTCTCHPEWVYTNRGVSSRVDCRALQVLGVRRCWSHATGRVWSRHWRIRVVILNVLTHHAISGLVRVSGFKNKGMERGCMVQHMRHCCSVGWFLGWSHAVRGLVLSTHQWFVPAAFGCLSADWS